MIKKVGIDIVENQRINLDEKFLKKFLTNSELERISTFQNDEARLGFISGRWAVKEAIIKTLDDHEYIPPNEIEIGYDGKAPIILNKNLGKIFISISHENNYSVGMAVREND
ncbi:holo-ACP synthase [[Acholeplasma] multilocale]|uniref:holo-ACP synthase n=1 Tax=[Acholeplasma] multilocale TaxID=264638 RepID=UPI00047CDA3D|nr:4'-phosphopantetheinyl transferase superfamily protein [[Acholeplasma] multilocale]